MDRLEAIEQFRNEIIDKVYKEREDSADTPDQIFMSEMCNYLKEAEIMYKSHIKRQSFSIQGTM